MDLSLSRGLFFSMKALNPTQRFVAAIVIAALMLLTAVTVASRGFDDASLGAVAFFALLAFAAHLLEYQLPRGSAGNISFIPYMAAVAVAPGLGAAIAAGLSVCASEVLHHRERLKAVFNISQYTASVALASIVYVAAGGTVAGPEHTMAPVPFAAAFAAYLLANSAAVSGVMAVSQGRRAREVWMQNMRGALLFDLFALPAVYGFAYVYATFGPLWTLAVALPLFGIRQLYKTNYQLERINEELLQLMVAAIEARDPYTSGHSQRVAAYSRIVSASTGLSPKQTDRIFTAALLHDVGKIYEEFAPILRKPGRLTDEEFDIMKSHSAKGAALVARVSQFLDLVPAIRGHHEAWNGTGYPDGLQGDRIPLWARVIALADTIDAMTTDRPYREALTPELVRSEIAAQLGRQFDPRIAASLIRPVNWVRMETAILSFQPSLPTGDEGVQVPRHSAAIEGALSR